MGRRLPVGGCRFFGAQKIFQYFLSGRTVPWYGADWTLCVQAQNHGAVSGRENAAVAAFSRPACAAPHANCVKPFVRRSQLRLSRNNALTTPAARRATTSI